MQNNFHHFRVSRFSLRYARFVFDTEAPHDASTSRPKSGKEDNSTITNINVPKDAREQLQKYGVTIDKNKIIIDGGIDEITLDDNTNLVRFLIGKSKEVIIVAVNEKGVHDTLVVSQDSIKMNSIEELYFGKTISQIRKEAGSFELSSSDYGKNIPMVGDIIFKPQGFQNAYIFRFDKKTERYICVNNSGIAYPAGASFDIQVPVNERKVVTRQHINNYNRANKKTETDSDAKRTAELAADNPERQKAISCLDEVYTMQQKAITQLGKLSTNELANKYGLESVANAQRFAQEESGGLKFISASIDLLKDGKKLASEVNKAEIHINGRNMPIDFLKWMVTPDLLHSLLFEDVVVARADYLKKMTNSQHLALVNFMLGYDMK